MSFEKIVTVAGQTIFVKVRSKTPGRAPGEKRQKRSKPTPGQVEKINQKNSENILSVIMNYNLKPGDYHLTLTYSGEPPTKDEARKELSNFIRRLTRLYRSKEIPLKWITATEYENKRIHHHLVCSGGVNIQEIVEKWGKGFIRPAFLDDTGDYRKLASYLIKETSKTFRSPDAVSKRRYNCSRSVVKPDSRVDDKVSVTQLLDPKPVKGYYIDQDSIYRGENPVTGMPYIEYVMVSLDPNPRIKYWNRGKKKKLCNEFFKVGDCEQVEIDFRAIRSYDLELDEYSV